MSRAGRPLAPPQAGVARPPTVHRPRPGDLGLMAVAVVAISTSGPLVTSVTVVVPALAVAFWRNALATGALLPFTLLRRREELRGLTAAERALAVGAGVLLAGHFATWVPSLTYTTVASATALGAAQPVWQALIARTRGGAVGYPVWAGIGLAVVGAGWLAGADFTADGTHLVGDALALAGGAFAAGYVELGGEVRRSVSTTTYTTFCYGTTAVVLLVASVVAGYPLAGYPASAWAKVVALTVGPQLLGHSLLNVVLRSTSPTVVSLTMLLEVPGASLIAALWLHQVPQRVDWVGGALLLAGIAVVVSAGRPVDAPDVGAS